MGKRSDGGRQIFVAFDSVRAVSGISATLMMLLGLWITTMEVRRHSRAAISTMGFAMAGWLMCSSVSHQSLCCVANVQGNSLKPTNCKTSPKAFQRPSITRWIETMTRKV